MIPVFLHLFFLFCGNEPGSFEGTRVSCLAVCVRPLIHSQGYYCSENQNFFALWPMLESIYIYSCNLRTPLSQLSVFGEVLDGLENCPLAQSCGWQQLMDRLSAVSDGGSFSAVLFGAFFCSPYPWEGADWGLQPYLKKNYKTACLWFLFIL